MKKMAKYKKDKLPFYNIIDDLILLICLIGVLVALVMGVKI